MRSIYIVEDQFFHGPTEVDARQIDLYHIRGTSRSSVHAETSGACAGVRKAFARCIGLHRLARFAVLYKAAGIQIIPQVHPKMGATLRCDESFSLIILSLGWLRPCWARTDLDGQTCGWQIQGRRSFFQHEMGPILGERLFTCEDTRVEMFSFDVDGEREGRNVPIVDAMDFDVFPLSPASLLFLLFLQVSAAHCGLLVPSRGGCAGIRYGFGLSAANGRMPFAPAQTLV